MWSWERWGWCGDEMGEGYEEVVGKEHEGAQLGDTCDGERRGEEGGWRTWSLAAPNT